MCRCGRGCEFELDWDAPEPEEYLQRVAAKIAEWHEQRLDDWEYQATKGDQPDGLISNNPLMQQIWECMLRPLTQEEINTPVRSMGHPWQIPSGGILYIPSEIHP